MHYLKFGVFLCFLFVACGEDGNDVLDCQSFSYKSSTHHLILIAGQSNTYAGRGLDLSIDTAGVGIMQLGRFDGANMNVIPASAPLEHHTPKETSVGFGLTFANLYKKNLLTENDSIILIPCGFGGAGFYNGKWNVGDSLYLDAVNRVLHLLNNFEDGRLQAILWHQGESDVAVESYKETLLNFIARIRQDTGDEKVPFILGGMVPEWVNERPSRVKHQEVIKSIQYQACNVGYADPIYPFFIEKVDTTVDVHFDAQGQREMGRRYFSEFTRLIEN